MDLQLPIYLVVPSLAWLVAQVLKRFFVPAYRQNSIKDLSFIFKSGNMPSSHAAIVASLLTMVAIRDGLGSSGFGIAFVLYVIVLYDAVNVRRSVGEQGPVVVELAKKAGLNPKIHLAIGHRITEVAAGSIIGFAVALVMLQFM
jgi:acid phosphatase family membrane protein YuiD